MMRSALLRLAVIVGGLAVASSSRGETGDGQRIVDLLEGNSIIHPEFGCVHYPDSTRSLVYVGDIRREGSWSVRDGLYYSSGQCGTIGCRVSGSFPNIVFERLDGGYTQPARVMKGDYCKQDGIIS